MDNERFSALEAHYNAILPTLATKADIEMLRADFDKTVAAHTVSVHSPDDSIEVLVTAAGDIPRDAARCNA